MINFIKPFVLDKQPTVQSNMKAITLSAVVEDDEKGIFKVSFFFHEYYEMHGHFCVRKMDICERVTRTDRRDCNVRLLKVIPSERKLSGNLQELIEAAEHGGIDYEREIMEYVMKCEAGKERAAA